MYESLVSLRSAVEWASWDRYLRVSAVPSFEMRTVQFQCLYNFGRILHFTASNPALPLVLSVSARPARSIAKFTLNVLKISSIKKEI